jgi:hypothetical protein
MLGNSSYVKGPPIHVRRKSKYDQQRTLLVFDKKKKKKKKKKRKKSEKVQFHFWEREREKEEKNWDFTHSHFCQRSEDRLWFDFDEILVCCF